MTTTTLYFCDLNGETIELGGIICGLDKTTFRAKFPGILGFRYDGFSYCVAAPKGSEIISIAHMLPVTRKIRYKRNPSLHECNARCQGGKCGGVCECSCGGRNHGINHIGA